MIFLPRSDDRQQADVGAEKIVFTVDFFPEAYELKPLELESTPLLEENLKSEPRLGVGTYRGVDWASKKQIFLVVGDGASTKLESLKAKALRFDSTRIALGIYKLAHEYMRDLGEFEATADVLAQCVGEEDRMIVAVDLFESKNCLLYVTPKPESRAQCFDVVGVALVRR